MYYSFTSLTTVGFGDYAPRANSERIMGSAVLLFGVAIFSYIMGNFIEILDQFRNLNAELNEGDKLECFFSMFQKFNGGHPLKGRILERIREHFDYKWTHDRNQAIDDEEEIKILMQLPDEVQDTLYSGFLFSGFLSRFA